ncbi:MAG: glycosyltransferase family 4 protein [Rhodobacteraceae bacterium]|nr:glycosyltransferase family 4 protein [Paracoccaceae bacterium]
MKCTRVVIINDFSLARGGATALALLSAKLFRARDVPVTLFCGDDARHTAIADPGVEIVSVGGKPLLEQGKLQAMSSGLYNTRAKSALEQLIRDKDTTGTIYHVHAWSLILSPSIFSALKPVAPRVVIHSHDQFLACPNGVFYDFQKRISCNRSPLGASCLATQCDKRSFLHKGWRVLRQTGLRSILTDKHDWGAVVAIHPKMQERLSTFGYGSMTLKTIRNPVHPFTTQRVKAEENSAFYFVGRMEPDKGIIELAHSARAAEVPLVTVGEGPLSQMLQTEFPEVRQEGWCDAPRLAVLLQEARAVVMPSLYAEPFGMVAIEAQQSGLPVILPHTAFLAEEITSRGLGLACDVLDPDDFTRTLTKMKNMPAEDLRRISETAYANETPFAMTPQDWGDSLLSMYDSLIYKAA